MDPPLQLDIVRPDLARVTLDDFEQNKVNVFPWLPRPSGFFTHG